MMLRRFHIPAPLLLVTLFVACDRLTPLAPGIEAASGQPGPTVPAPSNTNAVAVSKSQIDVSWRDNSTNESGFELDRSTAGASGAFTLRVTTGPNVTRYSDQGLDPSTQYCYKVRAFQTAGSKASYSSFSNTACATTPAPPPPPPPTPPAAPYNADALPQGSTAVGVAWRDNSTTEDGFRVERSLDAGATWAVAGTTRPDTVWFVDVGRTSEQPVCYRVIAFNVKGDSPPSNVDCTTPPAGPTDLAVATVNTLTKMAELTWTDNSAVEDGYDVVVCFETCTTYDHLPANSTSYVTECGDFISYVIVATKDGGYSDGSYALNPAFDPRCSGSTSATSAAASAVTTPPLHRARVTAARGDGRRHP